MLCFSVYIFISTVHESKWIKSRCRSNTNKKNIHALKLSDLSLEEIKLENAQSSIVFWKSFFQHLKITQLIKTYTRMIVCNSWPFNENWDIYFRDIGGKIGCYCHIDWLLFSCIQMTIHFWLFIVFSSRLYFRHRAWHAGYISRGRGDIWLDIIR
jgi:hypothetical protein